MESGLEKEKMDYRKRFQRLQTEDENLRRMFEAENTQTEKVKEKVKLFCNHLQCMILQ